MEPLDESATQSRQASFDLLAHEWTEALEEHRALGEAVLAQFHLPRGMRLKLELRDDPGVNAAVWRLPGTRTYVVQFHTGLLIWGGCLAADLCELSTKDFAPGAARFRHTRRFLDSERTVELDTLVGGLERAVEARQIGFWRSAFRTVLTVVLVHELAHVFRGHLDLLTDRDRGVVRIDELGVRTGRVFSGAIPIRSIEADADRAGAGLIARLAIDPPTELPWWALNTTRENVYLSLLMTLMFVLQMEHEAERFAMPSVHYPSPMLRITLVVSEINSVWQEAAKEVDDLERSVLEPVFGLIGDFEHVLPEVAFMRDFTEPTIRQAILEEADRTLHALERELSTADRYRFKRREASRW